MTSPLDRLTPAQREYAKKNLSQTVVDDTADDWTTDPLPEGGEGAEIEVDWGGGLFVATWRDGQWWVYNMAQPEGWDADGLRWRWATRPAEKPAEVQDTAPPFTATATHTELVTRVQEQEAQIESLMAALRKVREGDSAQTFLLKTALENVRAERDELRARLDAAHVERDHQRAVAEEAIRRMAEMEERLADYDDPNFPLRRAVDEIAALTGCPEWDYPAQVVRDVKAITDSHAGLVREREAVAEYVARGEAPSVYDCAPRSEPLGEHEWTECRGYWWCTRCDGVRHKSAQTLAAADGPDTLAAAAMKARQ